MSTGRGRGIHPPRAAAIAALLLAVAGVAAFDASHPEGASRPGAPGALAAAVDALGGAAKLSALDDWIVEGAGRENLSAELQGIAPDAPTWRPHEEKVAVRRATGTVAWERKTPRNDLSVRWRRFIYAPDSFGVVDRVAGRGATRARSNPAPAREALMRRIPHLLLRDVAAGSAKVSARSERILDGAPHDVVEIALPGEPPITLLIGRAPAVLVRAEYPVSLPGLGDVVVGWRWRGWKRDARLGWAPAGHVLDVGGTVFQEVAYSRYEAGSEAAAALLAVPANLTPRPESPTVAPAGAATGEVAPGVRVVEVRGFLGMFVEFGDFVAVFDAPAPPVGLEAIPASNRSGTQVPAEELADAIAAACPGKPIRYVVISHHHGDHLGGLRGFAGPGVTVLAAPSHAAAVRRSLEAPHALAGDSSTGSARGVTIETVATRKKITDGRKVLEAVNVGENPHTAENLFVWLPQERLVLQGDLFYYEEGEPFPPSGRETMNRFFARWLEREGLSPAAVYGVHGAGAAGPEALALAAR